LRITVRSNRKIYHKYNRFSIFCKFRSVLFQKLFSPLFAIITTSWRQKIENKYYL